MLISFSSGILAFTTMLMLTSLKLISFAYNYFDGTYDRKRVFGEHSDPKAAKMYADRKRFAITSLPNPLEFYGYVYCFTCLLAGPAFEYSDYASAIDGSAFKRCNHDSDPVVSDRPSSLSSSLSSFLTGVASMIIYLNMSVYFQMKNFCNPVFIATYSMAYRIGYTWLTITFERCKYYFCWKVAEASSILAGFGFEGWTTDGKPKGWGGVRNVDILIFETAPNMQLVSRSWNKRTQGWLERYTYRRTGNSLLATYFISALWHGLYPGFFIFFMSLPLFSLIERLSRLKINPLVIPGYNGNLTKVLFLMFDLEI